jgi:hypothetical protein
MKVALAAGQLLVGSAAAIGAFAGMQGVAMSLESVPVSPAGPASTQQALFTCINMGSAPGHPGKSLFICESYTGDVWLLIA